MELLPRSLTNRTLTEELTMGRKSKGDTSNYYIDPNELKESVIEMQELGYMTERFAKHLLTI